MNRIMSSARGIAALAVAAVLVGCASAPTTTAMQASSTVPAPRVKAPGSVVVKVSGGADAPQGVNIVNADFKQAVEASLTKAAIFDGVVPSGRYALQANVMESPKPMWGSSFTVDIEVAWTLVDTKSGATLLRKSIKSSHTATMADAFVGATRIRLAVEGAARKNIESMMQELAGISYLM